MTTSGPATWGAPRPPQQHPRTASSTRWLILENLHVKLLQQGGVGEHVDGDDFPRDTQEFEDTARRAAHRPDGSYSAVDQGGLHALGPPGEGLGDGRRTANLTGQLRPRSRRDGAVGPQHDVGIEQGQ